ncbi:riboflavin kinase [Patescibacteria group bacterium]|nr:riboflavin kinase [Patescibacteria group bacterium]
MASQRIETKNNIETPPAVAAAAVLNPPFYIAGKVQEGDKRGRELGFPTVNMKIGNLTIPYGVYVVLAKIKERILKGIAHVGIVETFNVKDPRCEVHLLDYNGDLYNERVELNLLKLLRQVKKFHDSQELVLQLKEDEKAARHFLKNL